MSEAPVLQLDGVDIGFAADAPLLVDVNLEVHPGEIIGILGRSGIGKTTLLRTIAGAVPPLRGEIESGAPLGYIPQRLGLVRHQSVGYNVLMGGLAEAPFWRAALSLPDAELRAATRDAVARVGLSEKMLEPISRLSGGQQRRVAIARSIVQQPALLLADECLGELDNETALEIIDLLRGVAKDAGIAIIIIDHNPMRCATFCDRVYNVVANKLTEAAT